MDLRKYFERKKLDLETYLSPEVKRIIKSFEYDDDAGCDLSSFLDGEDISKQTIDSIQLCIEAIRQIDYLESRHERLSKIEKLVKELGLKF